MKYKHTVYLIVRKTIKVQYILKYLILKLLYFLRPRKSLLIAIATIHSSQQGDPNNFDTYINQDVTAIGFDNPAFDNSFDKPAFDKTFDNPAFDQLNPKEIHFVDGHLNIRLSELKFIDQVRS